MKNFSSKVEKWLPWQVGEDRFELCNLDHPRVVAEIMEEMDRGVAVYYDTRWAITSVFAKWLAKNRSLFEGKRVLVLGAGVGEETVVLGKYSSQLYINDLSPTALTLCVEQLERNGILDAISLLGSYQEIDLPIVDLVVGSFLVYNQETLGAMKSFLSNHDGELLLVNEPLLPFQKLLKACTHRILFEEEDALATLFI